jgi:5-methylcytosine-specific restriction endonuclease McrA
MKRTPLNPISKQRCRKSNSSCKGLCSQCKNPKIVYETKVKKPINQISKKKRQQIEDEKPIREALYKRANGRCEICGRASWECLGGLHPHERVFKSHGGRISMSNSVICCNTCHGNEGHNLRIIEH